MKRFALFAGVLLFVATPALAQTDGTVVITPPGQPPALVPPGGSTEGANSVPGSTGSVSPTGRAEDKTSTDPARDPNAEIQSRPAPNTGVGSGSSGR